MQKIVCLPLKGQFSILFCLDNFPALNIVAILNIPDFMFNFVVHIFRGVTGTVHRWVEPQINIIQLPRWFKFEAKYRKKCKLGE
jgi:hypothetical protein